MANKQKTTGAHYTPPALAAFLAERVVAQMTGEQRMLRVLDPACGDGELLLALAAALPDDTRRNATFLGYEIDAGAAANTRERLFEAGVGNVDIRDADFLSQIVAEDSHELSDSLGSVDIVITNPPYVRTQVLGAAAAQRLAKTYNLTGRVDLSHAFTVAVTSALRPGGVLGLLTSNRFLVTLAGASTRGLLLSSYDIHEVFDLGDSKLFEAAVLPAIVVATRSVKPGTVKAHFSRIYTTASVPEEALGADRESPFVALLDDTRTYTRVGDVGFTVEHGRLDAPSDPSLPWSCRSSQSDSWLRQVSSRTTYTFADVAKIRVGIKTTADSVFIRADWDELPVALRPESELLRPLLTHHEAGRWRAAASDGRRRVLYPYTIGPRGKTAPVEIGKYPKTAAYLESHGDRLRGRAYVQAAGREWWEIWVAQAAGDWGKPKVVFPDISVEPRFSLDVSGAIVNGDCYWITLLPGMPPAMLFVILGIANSEFIRTFYDASFNNKLYAGRRRFMTQYVKRFPLPNMGSPEARELAFAVEEYINTGRSSEEEIERLVRAAFGV